MGSLAIAGVTLLDKVRVVKNKCIKNVFGFILVVSIILNATLLLYGTIFKISITVEDKTRYEMITYEDKNYIVLSTYEDKLLAVEYERKDDRYILKTYQYAFFDQFSCKYEYLDFESYPLIQYYK